MHHNHQVSFRGRNLISMVIIIIDYKILFLSLLLTLADEQAHAQ
jgi:hypothetical protein